MAKIEGSELMQAKLDRLLAAAEDPVPSDALMARVMADADTVLAEQRIGAAERPRGWLRAAVEAIGGWPAMAGLATATVAGIWIGYVQPGNLGNLAEGVLTTGGSYDLGDLMPGYDSLLVEG